MGWGNSYLIPRFIPGLLQGLELPESRLVPRGRHLAGFWLWGEVGCATWGQLEQPLRWQVSKTMPKSPPLHLVETSFGNAKMGRGGKFWVALCMWLYFGVPCELRKPPTLHSYTPLTVTRLNLSLYLTVVKSLGYHCPNPFLAILSFSHYFSNFWRWINCLERAGSHTYPGASLYTC